MEWLSVQQNVVTPDLLAHCEPISSTVAEQPSTSNDQTKMGKTVAFKPGTVIAPTLTTTGVADGNNSEDDYERALARQMSFSGSTTVIPKEDDEVVGETDIRVNRYEQSLVKYIEQLQGRFDHLETETNRVWISSWDILSLNGKKTLAALNKKHPRPQPVLFILKTYQVDINIFSTVKKTFAQNPQQ